VSAIEEAESSEQVDSDSSELVDSDSSELVDSDSSELVDSDSSEYNVERINKCFFGCGFPDLLGDLNINPLL